jgi:Tol biopolymer transport system component
MGHTSIGFAALVLFAHISWAAPGDTELVTVLDGTAVSGKLAGDDQSVSEDARYVLLYSPIPHDFGFPARYGLYILADRLSGTYTRALRADAHGNNVLPNTALSRDGRYVIYATTAAHVSGDTNGLYDVYLKDFVTGRTELISMTAGGRAGNAQSRTDASISADGRYVVFTSRANDLDPAAPAASVDRLYLRDRTARTTRLIPQNAANVPDALDADNARMSPNGRYLVFTAEQARPALGDTNDFSDVYLKDLTTGRIELISRTPSGRAGNQPSTVARVSDDGRYVVFSSGAANLVTSDINSTDDVFVRDRATGTTQRVSVDSEGNELSSGGVFPTISADGTRIAFITDYGDQAYVHDLTDGTKLVSRDSEGNPGNSGTIKAVLTADGRYAFMTSFASNLAPNDPDHDMDVFVHEITSGPDMPFDAMFTIKPAALDFGTVAVGSAVFHSFWLRNKGTKPLPMDVVRIKHDASYFDFWAYDNCGVSLAPGASCKLSVEFAPQTAGVKRARLWVEAGGELRTRQLTGEAR